MNNKQYHDNEMRLFQKKVNEVTAQTKQEKSEAKRALLNCWTNNPEIFGERIGWILNGTYGYGEMVHAIRMADNKRLNRISGLSQLIALTEWQCPYNVTLSAWKSLSELQQKALDIIIQAEIDYFEANREEYEKVTF